MDQLTDILAGADVTLEDDILDRIDQIVPPGVNLNPSDAGFQPQTSFRRRRPPPPARPPGRLEEFLVQGGVSVHRVRGETWSWACISPISPGLEARPPWVRPWPGTRRNAEAAGITRITVMDHFWQIRGVGPAEHEMLEAYTTLGFLAAHTRPSGCIPSSRA